jgi:hypothetical protein
LFSLPRAEIKSGHSLEYSKLFRALSILLANLKSRHEEKKHEIPVHLKLVEPEIRAGLIKTCKKRASTRSFVRSINTD